MVKLTCCPKCNTDICSLGYASIITDYIDKLSYDLYIDYESVKAWAVNNQEELLKKLAERISYADLVKSEIIKLPLDMSPRFYGLYNKYKAVLYECRDIEETVINNYADKQWR